MYVQFMKPTANGTNEPPENLIARAVLLSADPALVDVAIGGLSIWEGDGRKGRSKGTKSVSLPQYGVLAGRPVKLETLDEYGNIGVDHKPSAAGKRQLDKITAAILQVFQDEQKAGHDVFVGKFQLAIAMPAVIPAEPTKVGTDDAEPPTMPQDETN